ncbi:GNAT family N-acetyltransferase [Variovorax paradoxus]|uniref:GNAT family N-acetyltransferase n=1 Tax=Variovorax paradoxus TaxID=34073 RepID=UPI0021AC6183|nr:GNAT family N-acetyltransferase [Variovorax paradoxus]UVH59777.1 GNAT family N-acetyltransferase [Variovorax paradoxus]
MTDDSAAVRRGIASPYACRRYAEAVAQGAAPIPLQRSGGWLLSHVVGTTGRRDARACYPLFGCHDWALLPYDLAALDDSLVSVTAVIDPLHDTDEETLRLAFPDLLKIYKMHNVVDLNPLGDALAAVSSHHRRNIKLAMDAVDVEVCAQPAAFAAEWLSLYGALAERHDISGAADFSAQSLVAQLGLPGLTALRAVRNGDTVGMTLWLANERHAYYHLGAYSEQGYAHRASFAMFSAAIEHFAELGLACINLGAGAGVTGDAADGLSRFKGGWATRQLPAYLGGRIGDRAAYRCLSEASPQEESGGYFPAYRAPGAGRG